MRAAATGSRTVDGSGAAKSAHLQHDRILATRGDGCPSVSPQRTLGAAEGRC